MDVFHYASDTGEYLGQSSADESPLEKGVFLIPAHATTEPPPQPQGGFVIRFVDGAWGYSPLATPEEPPTGEPVASSAMVNAERDRRIAVGTTIDVAGYGDIPLTGTDRDMTIITALLVRAGGAHSAGDTSPSMVIRDRENQVHYLTPLQMLELTSKGMQWVEDTMAVSWAMKDGTAPFEEGIPVDYNEDSYWP